MSQQFHYRIWLPGHAPGTHEPVLTLHNATAVHFFVEAIINGSSLFFTTKPFAIVAYYVTSQFLERQTAEGVYQFDPNIRQFHAFYKSGVVEPDTDTNIISAALQSACAQVEREQVL